MNKISLGKELNYDVPKIAVENIIFGIPMSVDGIVYKSYDGIQSITETTNRAKGKVSAGNRVRHNIVTSPHSSKIEATLINIVDELKYDLLGHERGVEGSYVITSNSKPTEVVVSWVNVYADNSRKLVVYPSVWVEDDPTESVTRTSEQIQESTVTMSMVALPKNERRFGPETPLTFRDVLRYETWVEEDENIMKIIREIVGGFKYNNLRKRDDKEYEPPKEDPIIPGPEPEEEVEQGGDTVVAHTRPYVETNIIERKVIRVPNYNRGQGTEVVIDKGSDGYYKVTYHVYYNKDWQEIRRTVSYTDTKNPEPKIIEYGLMKLEIDINKPVRYEEETVYDIGELEIEYQPLDDIKRLKEEIIEQGVAETREYLYKVGYNVDGKEVTREYLRFVDGKAGIKSVIGIGTGKNVEETLPEGLIFTRDELNNLTEKEIENMFGYKKVIKHDVSSGEDKEGVLEEGYSYQILQTVDEGCIVLIVEGLRDTELDRWFCIEKDGVEGEVFEDWFGNKYYFMFVNGVKAKNEDILLTSDFIDRHEYIINDLIYGGSTLSVLLEDNITNVNRDKLTGKKALKRYSGK